jgi:heat shock protein HslJ
MISLRYRSTLSRAAIAALSLLAGCAGGSTDSSLSGTHWRVTGIDGKAPVAPQSAHIAFDSAQIKVSIGCNLLGGAYRIDGRRLIAGPFVTTEKACDDRLLRQEAAVNALLESAPLLLQDGPRLRLASGGHALELERRAS